MELLNVDFRTALLACASLSGMAVDSRSAALIARRRRQRQAEQDAREVIDEEFFLEWLAKIEVADDARGDQVVLRCLYRLDLDLAKPSTRAMIDQIGDPHLRELLAVERLAAVEADWRSWRMSSGYRPDSSWGLRVLDDTMTDADRRQGITIVAEMLRKRSRRPATLQESR